jgi:hypothetical protein
MSAPYAVGAEVSTRDLGPGQRFLWDKRRFTVVRPADADGFGPIVMDETGAEKIWAPTYRAYGDTVRLLVDPVLAEREHSPEWLATPVMMVDARTGDPRSKVITRGEALARLRTYTRETLKRLDLVYVDESGQPATYCSWAV